MPRRRAGGDVRHRRAGATNAALFAAAMLGAKHPAIEREALARLP
jgi:phosphoribosylcarboxyaminoimidazole (NCAIR) mutase